MLKSCLFYMRSLATGLAASLFAIALAQADDFQALSTQVKQSGTVNVAVSGGWNAVTGDIRPEDLKNAITGDIDLPQLQQQFVRKLQTGGAQVEQLYEFKYLPYTLLKVDQKGLANIKATAPKAKVWKEQEIKAHLSQSTSMIGAPQQWSYGGTGKGQIVAVLDSGVDANHPMLKGRVVWEACVLFWGCKNGEPIEFGPGSSLTKDDHGTHVAGIIAGNGNGIRGVAPEAEIISIKVLDERGRGMNLDILIAMDMIAKLVKDTRLPVAALNLSLGGGYHDSRCYDSTFSDAAIMLKVFGVAVISSAGNESFTSALGEPACAYAVYSVGALDKNWNVAEFSNSADFLDIVAPGVDITSAGLNDNGGHVLKSYQGTSMAAPHVAGAYAVMKQLYPDLSIDERFNFLKGGLVTDPKSGITSPVLTMPARVGSPNAGNGSGGGNAPAPQPAPQPAPTQDSGTIAITG